MGQRSAEARSDGREAIVYRVARLSDLPIMGRVYLSAFRETLVEIGAPDLSESALSDLMSTCLIGEPGCAIVAEAAGEGVVGYIIAMADVKRSWRAAALRALPVLWCARWLSGRYRAPLSSVSRIIADKLVLMGARRRLRSDDHARIVSIAVTSAWQGRSVGSGLLVRGLDRLRALGRRSVWLEVRVGNDIARRLYLRFGFREAGTFRDSRSEWTTMVLDLLGAMHEDSRLPG